MSGADAHDMGRALADLGLVESGTSEYAIVEESDWVRGGAETYLMRFRVQTATSARPYLLKSVVSLGGGGVGRTAAEWLARRSLIARAGVRVPRLFAFRNATFLEEFVPLALGDAIRRDAEVVELIRSRCVSAAGAISALGFRPVSLFADARSHGQDVVVVDFGADLGSASGQPDPDWTESALARYFGHLGWSLTDAERKRVRGD